MAERHESVYLNEERQTINDEIFPEDKVFSINQGERITITDCQFDGATTFYCHGGASLQLDNNKFHQDVFIVAKESPNVSNTNRAVITPAGEFVKNSFSSLVNNSPHRDRSNEHINFTSPLKTFFEQFIGCFGIVLQTLNTPMLDLFILICSIGIFTVALLFGSYSDCSLRVILMYMVSIVFAHIYNFINNITVSIRLVLNSVSTICMQMALYIMYLSVEQVFSGFMVFFTMQLMLRLGYHKKLRMYMPSWEWKGFYDGEAYWRNY